MGSSTDLIETKFYNKQHYPYEEEITNKLNKHIPYFKKKYRNISKDNAYKIKVALGTYQIKEPIDLIFRKIYTSVHIECLGDNKNLSNNDYESNLLYAEDDEFSLFIEDRRLKLSIGAHEWRDWKAKIKGIQVYLSSNYIRLGKFFADIELSEAVEDDKYIYILKNISKLKGEGAIERLNKGIHRNKKEQHKRRETLVKRFDGTVIRYKKEEWLVVSKILKEDLTIDDRGEDVVYNFIKDFVKYAFIIEEIVKEK